MALTISSAFDAGNIRVVQQDGDRVDLEIVKDHLSDFYQWFHFRVAGAEGREVTLRITNCGGFRLSQRLAGLQSRGFEPDREEWLRVDGTSYADGVLTIRFTPPIRTCVWFAYFAPYSMERHHDLVTRPARASRRRLSHRSARALDGQDIDCLTIGEGQLKSGSTPASTRARAWPNGGWKARSKS